MGGYLPNFRVDAVDQLPAKPARRQCGVINADDSSGPGTHWVGYFVSPETKYVLYFDPFGMDVDPRVATYLKRSGKEAVRITTQVQDLTSEACGYYVLYFLDEMNSGVSVGEFLVQFDPVDQTKNERILKKFFRPS